jgi:DNA-binding NtrC family response regulator
MPPILLVEDRDSLRAVLRQTLEGEGYEVEEAADGKRAIAALSSSRYLAVVTDLKLPGADGHAVLAAAREADPDLPVVVMTAYGTVEDAVGAMKQGAFDFLSKPVDPDHLVLLLKRAVERRQLLDENLLLKKEFAERLGFPSIIGESSALVDVIRRIRKAAPADATVLLEGESGTGKELFARAIHHLSPRKDAPFVAINCAAIPETLLESELFGHEKGAFTGASSARPGRFELADRGTLFLDEIGELGPGVQAKLLRVLQERKFERVGGNRTIAVNVRIVAATNRDLKVEVGARRFRDDLYFRLAVVTVTIPPLRDRRSDIPLLARHFLEKYRREVGRDRLEFSAEALDALRAHRWPGNVRELENLVERIAILAEGDRLEPAHLGLDGPAATPTDLAAFARVVGLEGGLDAVSMRARDLAERLVVERALAEAGGNKTRAAQLLDVNYKRLLARIRELGLESEREEEPSKELP